jgi:hypothetical protein
MLILSHNFKWIPISLIKIVNFLKLSYLKRNDFDFLVIVEYGELIVLGIDRQYF